MERAVLRKLVSLCVICGLVGLALLGLTAIHDEKREWKQYQEAYKEQLLEKVGADANPALYKRISGMKPEIRQIVIEELGAVDRCITCHTGITDPLFADAKQPFRTHPDLELLEHHPVETFGCTICHGGQGLATTYDGAAHMTIAHWPDPMVDRRFMQSRCGYCHENHEVIKADTLALGKRIYKELHCAGCHKIDPDDGSMAPTLSAFADKDTGHFDFKYIEGDHSIQNWVLEHFLNPTKVSPGSPMTIYAMNDHQIEALTTYILSLTEREFSRSYYPKAEPIPSGETALPR